MWISECGSKNCRLVFTFLELEFQSEDIHYTAFLRLDFCRHLCRGGFFRIGKILAQKEIDIDKDIGTLLANLVVVQEDATTGHLVHFVGIGDGHGTLANEPYVAIHTAVVGEVEGGLFLARRIGLVVAVVGHDGNQTVVAGFNARLRQIDNDGQIAAFVLFYFLAVDVDFLPAHDGFEIEGDFLVTHVGGHGEMLAVPYYALIVAAAAGFAGHEHGRVGCTYHLPL